MKLFIALIFLLPMWECSQPARKTEPDLKQQPDSHNIIDTVEKRPLKEDNKRPTPKDEDLVNVLDFSDDFIPDIRYATKNNFMDSIMYPCGKCLLRYEILKDLLKAQKEFASLGYKIKLLDCYRPLSVQKAMWKKYPIPGLVADPATGSRHNRGTAVDLTLIDPQGNDLDMGTEYDDFSRRAHTFSREVDIAVHQNRMLLREIMQKHHFIGINSEWWHFSHDCGPKYRVLDTVWACD
ncbi:MAG: M15 family metallopeptidase [Bacteroidota bacterium]|nr:M15 family metallopeptidase [Bacteroidota bacterium]